MRSVFVAATKKYASRASDEALVTLVQVVLDQTAVAARNNPEMCVQLLFQEPGRFVDYSKIIGKDLADRELKAMEGLFRTAAANPNRPVPTEAEVSDALVLVVTAVRKRGVKEEVLAAMENPREAKVDPGQLCAAVGVLYQEVLALPANERGLLLRFMLSD